jgi:class 3 adenylate cyclase
MKTFSKIDGSCFVLASMLGNVLIEGSDLFGDGVNIAARLESLPEAIGAVEEAIALNRNDSLSHRLLALLELQSDRPERSRIMIEQTMRLSPRDPIAGPS